MKTWQGRSRWTDGPPRIFQRCFKKKTSSMFGRNSCSRSKDRQGWPWTGRSFRRRSFYFSKLLKSFQLQEVIKHIRLGQLCILELWWADLKPGKGSIRRPSMLTTVVLEKKQYTPVDAVMSFRDSALAGAGCDHRPSLVPVMWCRLYQLESPCQALHHRARRLH